MKKNKLSLNKIEISSLDASRLSDGGKNVLGGADTLQKPCMVSDGVDSVCFCLISVKEICKSIEFCESAVNVCITQTEYQSCRCEIM